MARTLSSIAAEQALRRAARRRALQAAIGRICQQINAAKAVKAALNGISAQIAASVCKWQGKLAAFQASAMASVVVTDKFEGETAKKIAAKIPEPIKEMEATEKAAGEVQTEIAEQISKLDKYIENLESKKAALEAELASV